MLTVRDPVGKVNITPGKCAIGRGLVGITPKRDVCESIFLFLSLKRVRTNLDSISYGVIKSIGPKEVKEIKIDYISIEKQKEISSIFDGLEGIRAVLKNMLNATMQLEQRALEEMFSPEMVS